MEKDRKKMLVHAAQEGPCDLRVDNVRVVDVYNGTIFESSVCVTDGVFTGFSSLPAKEVLDGRGAYLLPGLMDAHVHIESSMLSPERFAELVLPLGTTAIIADPHEIANVKGTDALRYMLESSRNLPLDIRFMLPSCVPALPFEDAGAVLTAEDLAPFMADEKVAGLGEMMNVPGLLSASDDVLDKIALSQNAGKQTDGHSPSLSGSGLDAYALAGVRTDHECTTPKELEDRVRRGMYVLLREGSAAHDLLNLLPAVTPANSRRCLFCTDDRQCADILERGHMTNHLRLAVAAGLDPVTAIRMASLNTAEAYGLKDKGAIAPGMEATFLLVQNLKDFAVQKVWVKGQLTAEDGKLCHPLASSVGQELRKSMLSAMNTGPLPTNLDIAVPSGKARVIRLLPHSLLTECRQVSVHTDNGIFQLEKNPGLLKLAVLERHKATGKLGLALLDGEYGLRGGAIATSISHDSHNIVAAGDNDADILMAFREMTRMGGGIVMVSAGTVLAALPLPIAGLMADEEAHIVAGKLKKLLNLAKEHYHIWEKADAFMSLSFLALPVIPSLKLTPSGLFDVDKFQFVSLAVE